MLIVKSANAPLPPEEEDPFDFLQPKGKPSKPQAPAPVQAPAAPAPVQAPVQEAPAPSPAKVEPATPPPLPPPPPKAPAPIKPVMEFEGGGEKTKPAPKSELGKASAMVDALGWDESSIEASSEIDSLGLELARTVKETEDTFAEMKELEKTGQEQEAEAKQILLDELAGQYNDIFTQILSSHIQRRQYKYEAKDASGEVSSGVVDAGTPSEAAKKLSEKGLEAVSLDAVMEENTLQEFVEKQVDKYKKSASEKNIPEDDIAEAPDTLAALIENFANKAYKNPGMRNSLTSYILSNLKWTIMPANKYYRIMRYVNRKPGEQVFDKEIEERAAKEGWPENKKILEQYKIDAWGGEKKSLDRISSAVDWWNKMYKSLFPNAPLSQVPDGPLGDPLDPNTNDNANLRAFRHMQNAFDSAAKNPNPKVQELVRRLGLVKNLDIINKQYQGKNGSFSLDPRMFDPSKMTPFERDAFESPDPSAGGGYKKAEIGKWNEMYERIAKEDPELVKLHPAAKPLRNGPNERPSPEDVRSMSSLFDDFAKKNQAKAIEIGLIEKTSKAVKPYVKEGEHFLSQEMVKPSKRGVHLKHVEEAIDEAKGGSKKSIGGDEEGGQKEFGKGKGGGGVVDAPGSMETEAVTPGSKIEINPMTSWRRPGIPPGTEEDILSSVWGRPAASGYASIKNAEDEIKSQLAEPVDDAQMKEIMLGDLPLNGKTYDKVRHLSELINIYFDPEGANSKYKAAQILSDVSKKWEGVRPALTGKLPKEAIEAELPRRQAILKLLAEKSTREGTLDRKIADTIAKMPFEVSSAKSTDPNYEMHKANAAANRRTMRLLFEESKPEISKLIVDEGNREYQQSEINALLTPRFNDLVRSVMGRMMGTLVNPSFDKDLAAMGIDPTGSWRKAFIGDLRVMRVALSSMAMEKTS